MKILNHIIIFLKGFFMGLAYVGPGISGGTIAVITGIYERLIIGIKNLNISWALHFIKYIITKKKREKELARRNWNKIDLHFFIPLGLGTITAVLLGARLILYALEKYYSHTMYLFIGLVFASSIIIYKNIPSHSFKQRSFGIIGIIIGLLFTVEISTQLPTNFFILGISGFIGAAAMLLPGISGSYLLLLIGQYDAVLAAIQNFDVPSLGIIGIGILLGILIMSRIISWLLEKYNAATLYALLGLILGSLLILFRGTTISLSTSIALIVGFFIPLALQYNKKNKRRNIK